MKVHRLMLLFAAILALCSQTFADQLDEVATRPAGVLVKIDPQTKTVRVYKADAIDPAIKKGPSASNAPAWDDAMKSEIARVERPENLIAELHEDTASELDHDTSTPACWGSSYWSPGWDWYGWGGYSYPSYSYWSNPWGCPGSFSYSGYSYGYGLGYGYGGSGYPYYGGSGYPYYGYGYPCYGWYW